MERWARGLVGGIVVGGTVVFTAWAGYAGRLWGQARAAYVFDPARLELRDACPTWLQPAMAHALLESYLEAAGPPFSLLEHEALAGLARRLRGLPWVKAVAARPIYPDRLDLSLELRRPIAATLDARGRLWLYAADGVRLDVAPAPEQVAPEVEQIVRASPGRPMTAVADLVLPYDLPLLLGGGRDCSTDGEVFAEAALVAAVAEREFWPSVRSLAGATPAELPVFLGVDLTLAGRGSGPEFSLVVRAVDGGVVWLGWGHSPRTRYKRIASQDKAAVFVLLLGEHPGLAGVEAADLRFQRRWRDRVVLRPPPAADTMPADAGRARY